MKPALGYVLYHGVYCLIPIPNLYLNIDHEKKYKFDQTLYSNPSLIPDPGFWTIIIINEFPMNVEFLCVPWSINDEKVSLFARLQRSM